MLAWPWGSCMETTLAKLLFLALRPWIWALKTCANSSHCWRSGSMMQVCLWPHLTEQLITLVFSHWCLWVGCVCIPCLYLPSFSLCQCCLCREPDIWPVPVEPQCPGFPGHGHRGNQPQTEEKNQYRDQHSSGLRKELSGGEKHTLRNSILII